MTIATTLAQLDTTSKEYFDLVDNCLGELYQSLTEVAAHYRDGENPHKVTKAQVGLGKVHNFALATETEAKDRWFGFAYMSPYLAHIAVNDRLTAVDKSFVGLGSLQNYPIATENQARDGNNNAAYMTPLRTQQNFEENTKHLQGRTGDILFVSEDYRPMAFEAGLMVKRNPALVQGSTEMDQLKGYVESFELVFDDWLRISHDNSGTFPADVAETTSWTFDPAEDAISCTINSATMIGFISPDRHDDFIFDVIVKSTAGDDDSIGICFGFVAEDGVEHTLTAFRTTGGTQGHTSDDGSSIRAKLFDVYYDYFDEDGRVDLGSTNGGLLWGDGVVDDSRVPLSDIGAGGWGAWPEGCRIRVERFGDVFTVQTSDLGQTTLKASATITIDINDYPELEKFRGPIQFGYVCYSQPNSTWEVLRRPVELGTGVDADTLEAWTWDGKQFVTLPESDAKMQILPNRLYYTEMTGKLYYSEPFKGLIKISG
jgi:hypothetical protein